jgi:site-specific DNA recombinase
VSKQSDVWQQAHGPRALVYLRVSTMDQAKRGGEAEGYSLPAQREACLAKAESLGAIVVGEYVDGGESARTDKRNALQQMLTRIKTERDVDLVIIHKVNRWARNREDDALLGIALRKASVDLISASENIDATPTGRLTHGILATLAEYESANLGLEVIKGTTQKVKMGGTPKRAPIGYLNVRELVDGIEERTVVVDPERGPLVKWAFDAYASGHYSLPRLLDELTDKGLTTKPTRSIPPHPLYLSNLHVVLRNPYYKGDVLYRGVYYDGKHEKLVSSEVFDQVQVLLSTRRAGSKERVHDHYLRGSLFCKCGRRMCFTLAKGHGGSYGYYFCLSKQQRRCDQPYVRVDDIEKQIAAKYRAIQLTKLEAEELQVIIWHSVAVMNKTNSQEVQRQQRRWKRLENHRTKLLRAHYDDAIPLELLKAEQKRITREMADCEEIVRQSQIEYAAIEANLEKALKLASACGREYAKASQIVRRLFNQAFFEKFVIENGDIIEAPFTRPVAVVMEGSREARHFVAALRSSWDEKARTLAWGWKTKVREAIFSGLGLSNDALVGVRGIEPRTFTL